MTNQTQTAERVRVKLYFDANNICLGGCCDDNWLPLYSGEEYVASEFFKLVPGFDPVGKTVKELQEIERQTNPYAIKAAALAAAAEKEARAAERATAELTLKMAAAAALELETERAALAAERVALEAEKTALEVERAALATEKAALAIEVVAAEVAKLYPALGKIKIDYPNLDISELELAFKNGEVLAIKQIKKGSIPIFLVLRVWGENKWVTHHYNAAANGFESGWYFGNLKEAKANFSSRKRLQCLGFGPVTR